MTKKEIIKVLANELRLKGMKIQYEGIASSIVDDVYNNKNLYKFFLISKDNYNCYDYEFYMCSDWEIETQEIYFNKRKHIENLCFEVQFEKRSFKGITVWNK